MLTEVILDGEMGKKFGRRWNIAAKSPAEALKIIDINKNGLMVWIRDNLKKYENYKVLCTYENGSKEYLDEETFKMEGKIKSIRFTPIITGAGNVGRIIAGIVIIAIAWWNPLGWSAAAVLLIGAVGAGIALQGVVGLLTPQPKVNTSSEAANKNRTSQYFDGPTNTVMQGVPVPLIYGTRVKTGSHPIYVSLTVDEAVN